MTREENPSDPEDVNIQMLHLGEDVLQRIQSLADKKNKDPMMLARDFIIERLYEEEKREGMLASPASPSDTSPQVGRDVHSEEGPATGFVEIYTDGGCKGNPGPGGWAAVIYEGPEPREISGAQRSTTNQQMELRAAIEGLRSLGSPSRVRIYSDSAYLINAFKEEWLDGWERNGWRKANKKPVMNTDLWKELLQVTSPHEVEWIKVEGHAGNTANERCHQLVQVAINSVL
jgi:ribonuclease HI